MDIGISTGCLYPMLTEDCIKALCDIGFRNFEIFFNTFSELETNYLDNILKIISPYNARVVSIHPFTSGFESYLLFSNYERRFYDGVAFYEKYFRTAKYIGANKVVLHGLMTVYKSSLTNSEYFRRFDILQNSASKYNVSLLQENVNLFRSNDIGFIKDMKTEIPLSAGFVCDIKQAVRGDISPFEMIKTMGNRLGHIHINDFDNNGKCVLPGKGCFDFDLFFDTIKNTGFDNVIIIEVYRSSFETLNELSDSYEFLKKFL